MIYEYLDYRLFLKDFFESEKKKSRGLTHREVLRDMNITSTGFLANVMSGKKNLSIDQAKSFCEAVKLGENESKYFKYLVYFQKAKLIDEKNDFYEMLHSLRRANLKKLNKKQLSLFSRWYYVVIRELIDIFPIGDDFKKLGAMLEPKIKASDAKKAVEELLELGLIKMGADGFYEQKDKWITTGNEIQSYYVSNFNKEMTELSARALDKVPSKERELSGLTLGLSQEGFKKAKKEIQDFRKRILKIAEEDKELDRVYRAQFKLFPVSKKGRGK